MQRLACVIIAGMLACLLLTAPAVAFMVFGPDSSQNITLSDPSFSLGIPAYDRNLTKPSATMVYPKDPALNITLSDPSFSIGIPGYGNDDPAPAAPEIPTGNFVVFFPATQPVFLQSGFMVLPGF